MTSLCSFFCMCRMRRIFRSIPPSISCDAKKARGAWGTSERSILFRHPAHIELCTIAIMSKERERSRYLASNIDNFKSNAQSYGQPVPGLDSMLVEGEQAGVQPPRVQGVCTSLTRRKGTQRHESRPQSEPRSCSVPAPPSPSPIVTPDFMRKNHPRFIRPFHRPTPQQAAPTFSSASSEETNLKVEPSLEEEQNLALIPERSERSWQSLDLPRASDAVSNNSFEPLRSDETVRRPSQLTQYAQNPNDWVFRSDEVASNRALLSDDEYRTALSHSMSSGSRQQIAARGADQHSPQDPGLTASLLERLLQSSPRSGANESDILPTYNRSQHLPGEAQPPSPPPPSLELSVFLRTLDSQCNLHMAMYTQSIEANGWELEDIPHLPACELEDCGVVGHNIALLQASVTMYLLGRRHGFMGQ